MAIPTSFVESNCVLDKPKDMTYNECEALSVLKTTNQFGSPVIVSCWKLTQEELAEVIKNQGRIWLGIYGITMPPAFISGIKPFGTK